jgi:Ca-activated chloride channel family protein
MKQFSIAILMLLCSPALFAQDAKSYIHKGNELYNKQKFDEAAANYAKSIEKKGLPVEGSFNLGDALYKEKKYGDAAQHFTDITTASNDATVKAKAYHNLGNSLLQSKKYDESIAAYEKSLTNNPKDDATRYNLAYAQEMLKKQQQQKKNDQNKNNQNKNNQNNKDKSKSDQDKNKDKNNQNKNNQDQNKQNQDKQNQQNQQQQPDKLSKADAQHMLDALNDQEKNTQDKLKNKKLKGAKMHIDKDW